MPLPDSDGAVGHSFGLELDDVNLPLLEVIGLVLSAVGLERGAGHDSGTPSHRRATLVRPFTRDRSFVEWVHSAEQHEPAAAARRVSVAVFADDGTRLARYHLENARAVRLEIGTHTGGPFIVERLTVGYDDIEVL